MLLAVFADIHANRQAFGACLDFARARGAERMICLGDYVGYGADPEWTVETVMGLVDDGAMAVRGNHDNAVGTPDGTMNAEAQAAIEWTRGRLSAAQRRFLAELPLDAAGGGSPLRSFRSQQSREMALCPEHVGCRAQHRGDGAHVTFCGHIHQPALYSMSSAAKMTSFVPTSGVPVQLLGGGAGSPFSARWGSPAMAIRRPRLRCSIPGPGKSPIAVCPTMSRRQRGGFAKMACRTGWPIACWSGGERWPRPSVQPGAVIDGFTIGECVHRGGMATLWSVTRPDIAMPLLMKIPRVSEGEDPAAIVSFEMEQMILPRLSGPHVPACFGTGDFARQAYVVIERIPGKTLYSRLGDLPLAYEEASVIVGKIAVALADLHRQNVIHHDIKPSSIMFRPSGEAVLIDFGLSHHNQLPDLAAGRIPAALRHRALHGARAVARGARRSAQRPVFAGRAAVLLHHRRAAVRRERNHARHAAAAVARSASAAQAQAGLSALAAGSRAAVSGDRAGVAPPTASQLAFELAHPDQIKLTARSERLKARSHQHRLAPPLQSRPDPAESEIRSGRPTGFGSDRGDRARYRGGIERAERGAARDRRTNPGDAAIGEAGLPERAEDSAASPSTGRSTSRATTSTSIGWSRSGIGRRR